MRPVNLNLMTIKLPSTAIVSILHRISGVCVFLLMPLMLYKFQESLISAERFAEMQQCLAHPAMKLLVWFFFSSLLFHALAGIRHLLMDLGLGETPKAGRASAWFVFILTFIGILCLGNSLW